MTITYMPPIDGEEMANISEFEINEMTSMVYDTRKKILSGKPIPFGRNTTLERWNIFIKKLITLDDVFVIRVFDENKLVGYRFVRPMKYCPFIYCENEEDEKKYKYIKDWLISEGLNLEEGIGSGQQATHKDYLNQGIGTKVRLLCNEETKRRGYTWALVYDLDTKVRWDWSFHYYTKYFSNLVMSDIKTPMEFGGYGKLFYYRI